MDRETAELLHQRLEAESRRRYPSIWNAIDRIRTHAAKGPGREKRTVRYRIYGLFLLALGLLTLILGLMPPKTTDVIIAGAARSLQACWSLPLFAEERRRAYLHPAKRRRGKRWSCGAKPIRPLRLDRAGAGEE